MAATREHLEAGSLRIQDLCIASDEQSRRTALANAPFADQAAVTGVTHGIGINAITGTVVEDLLWAYEYVPSGVCFKLTADLIPPVGQSLGIEEINALLSALLSVGSSPPLALGQGRTHGLGLAQVSEIRATGITTQQLSEWAQTGGDLRSLAEGIPISARAPAANLAPISLLLQFPHGLLAGEPGLVKAKPGQQTNVTSAQAPTKETANQQFARDAKGHPIVRGSALKGLLRAHCVRILATAIAAAKPHLAPNSCREEAKSALGTLFGSKDSRSRISVSDARSIPTGSPPSTLRTFVAVDRFTGGAAKGRLYSAHAATACSLAMEIHIDGQLADWEKGLLLHAGRDALEGDMAVGWGKSKGLGHFYASWGKIDASNWRDQLQAHSWVNDGLRAFDRRVAELVQTLIRTEA